MPYEDAGDEMPEDGSAEPDSSDHYEEAGAAIRQALAAHDDAALAHAICDLIDIHTSQEPDGDEEEGPKSKPNLAAILLARPKKK